MQIAESSSQVQDNHVRVPPLVFAAPVAALCLVVIVTGIFGVVTVAETVPITITAFAARHLSASAPAFRII